MSRRSSPPEEIFVVAAKRTPFGGFGGGLASLSATDLGVEAARAALTSTEIDPTAIDHVIFGNVLQTSADAIYLARHIGLRCGVPVSVPALTVNRLCGSGFQAIVSGAHEILRGDAQVVLVGGTESMSQAPHAARGLRFGVKLGSSPPLEDTLWAALHDPYAGCAMGETAENLAQEYAIDREQADAYALLSQERWARAHAAGAFAAELSPVTVPARGGTALVDRDEHPRPETSREALARLKPVFGGVVTAGNASGIGDGAAALVLASRAGLERMGVPPLARLVTWHVAGVDPHRMGAGPIPAIRGALRKADLAASEVHRFEVNEAFAPQYLAVEKELELPRARTNVEGGAIALAHPLGASGARIAAHLVHALRAEGGGVGIGSACIGGGQGIAVVLATP